MRVSQTLGRMTRCEDALVLLRVASATIGVVLLISGCAETAPTAVGDDVRGGDEPTTPRALAFVAAEHTGDPSSATTDTDAVEEFQAGGVGAELRFGSDGEYDGDMLVLAVGSELDPALLDCDSPSNDFLAGCHETEHGLLMWEDEAPEEDPGVVYVAVPKGDASVLVVYAGPAISADPRDLELPISVETLFAIAQDPRVDLTTSLAAVEGGKDIDFWRE